MNWEYCECGCHGHEVQVGSLSFWVFNDLNGNFYLHKGHGRLSPLIGKFKSWKEADYTAKEVVEKEINKMKKSLKKVRT